MPLERLTYRLPELDKTNSNQRAFLMAQLFELYSSQINDRKKENWKRYLSWLKSNNIPHTKENVVKFSKNRKLFIKEFKIKEFSIKLSHLKKEDLYYMISVAKDKRNRGESVGVFIFGSVKVK